MGEGRCAVGSRSPQRNVPVPVAATPTAFHVGSGPLQPRPFRIRPRALRRSRRISARTTGTRDVVPRKNVPVRGRAVAGPLLSSARVLCPTRTRNHGDCGTLKKRGRCTVFQCRIDRNAASFPQAGRLCYGPCCGGFTGRQPGLSCDFPAVSFLQRNSLPARLRLESSAALTAHSSHLNRSSCLTWT